MTDDAELLRRYAVARDEDAFAELVRRHVDFVYSAALRQLNGDAHLAADATQLVFTDLARKAATVAGHRVLAGWLFTSTRFASAKLVRGERRRQAREQEAHLMQTLGSDESASLDWERVRPVLDDVLGELKEADREAILLRFFEGRDFASVGAKLNLADNTARMRVERALDKLRALLERRGVKSTSAALAAALAHQAVAAAPAGLASAITGAALAGGTVVAGAGGFATVAATGVGSGAAATATFMSMTKLQLGLSSALVVAGATGFVVQADTNAKLREDIAAVRQENTAIGALDAENRRLARTAVDVEEMRRDDVEFARLQQEAGALRTRLEQLARAEQARSLVKIQPPPPDGALVLRERTAAFDISMLDQQPAPRLQARPQYPFEMRRAGISGEVVVDFVVNTAGDVVDATAVRSSRREFEEAAVQAVSKWKFKPGRKGGQDVATHLQVPLVFTLTEESGTPGGMTVKDSAAK
jgi:RNA polymerase sigma factor (sigma-70 family)